MSNNHQVWPKDRRGAVPQQLLPNPRWGFKNKDLVWYIGAKVTWKKRSNHKVCIPSNQLDQTLELYESKRSQSIPRSQVNIKELQEQETSRAPLDFWTDPVKHKMRKLKFRWDTTFKVCAIGISTRTIIRSSHFRLQLQHLNKTSLHWTLRLW